MKLPQSRDSRLSTFMRKTSPGAGGGVSSMVAPTRAAGNPLPSAFRFGALWTDRDADDAVPAGTGTLDIDWSTADVFTSGIPGWDTADGITFTCTESGVYAVTAVVEFSIVSTAVIGLIVGAVITGVVSNSQVAPFVQQWQCTTTVNPKPCVPYVRQYDWFAAGDTLKLFVLHSGTPTTSTTMTSGGNERLAISRIG